MNKQAAFSFSVLLLFSIYLFKILPPEFHTSLGYAVFGISFLLALLFLTKFHERRLRSEKTELEIKVKERTEELVLKNKVIEEEKKRSDELLLNILPAEVAKELIATGSAKARHFDNVTILFTDFVDFTTASERMTPQQLIDELHACFKAFDEISTRYNIEKIKTIGDAYLAAAGLPAANNRHAEDIVHAAIEISKFMKDRFAVIGERTFRIRIGIHSGSVVAGIVGVKKFAYDIWGDAVNTAARMEQNGEPGHINISATTFELIKDKFTCTSRGVIDVKGKGKLEMYYVKH